MEKSTVGAVIWSGSNSVEGNCSILDMLMSSSLKIENQPKL